MLQDNDNSTTNAQVPGLLVEDECAVGGKDAETGADVIRPKTSEGFCDENTTPTDAREKKS